MWPMFNESVMYKYRQTLHNEVIGELNFVEFEVISNRIFLKKVISNRDVMKPQDDNKHQILEKDP